MCPCPCPCAADIEFDVDGRYGICAAARWRSPWRKLGLKRDAAPREQQNLLPSAANGGRTKSRGHLARIKGLRPELDRPACGPREAPSALSQLDAIEFYRRGE